MAAVLRAMTISETRGFMKVLIEMESDRILGFTMFGTGAGEIMTTVQMAMLAGLPYTAVRDAVIAHPTMSEGLIPLFGNVPPISASDFKLNNGRHLPALGRAEAGEPVIKEAL
jgi:hypothetical protein